MATVDPISGYVNILGQPTVSNHLGLGTGTAYDFDTKHYYFMSPNNILTDADIVNDTSWGIPFNPGTNCTISSPQYVCTDSSLYGFEFCTQKFGKFDLNTGTLTSPNISFAPYIPGESYAFDKRGNRYMWITMNTLYIIDLNTFTYTTQALPIPANDRFLYFEYNCYDSCLYGAHSVQNSISYLFAKYNLATNTFTDLNSTAFVAGGILGGGRALDIVHGRYYYNVGTYLVSVNINDGSHVVSPHYTFSIPGPEDVYYIKIDQTCECERPNYTGINEYQKSACTISFPSFDQLEINTTFSSQATIRIFDLTSALITERTFTNYLLMNTEELPQGIYMYSIVSDNFVSSGKFLKSN
jgi:hypothetical protein